jgi:hypothetical protein
MQDSSIFGFIDPLSGKQTLDSTAKFAFFCQCNQAFEGFLCDPVFGDIHHDIVEPDGKLIKPPGISGKQIPHVKIFYLFVVSAQVSPAFGCGWIFFGKHVDIPRF